MDQPRTRIDSTLVLIIIIGASIVAAILALLAAWNIYAGIAGITAALTVAALLPPD